MVEVETASERRTGITLVRATVTNTRTTPQFVRLRSTLDGPTWPPGRGRVGAPEWNGDTWEGVVEPGQCRGVGFATPAAPAKTAADSASESEVESRFESESEPKPPLELVTVERASAGSRTTTREVLADLDDWSPPTDVFSRSRSGSR
ncbi:hypothetical protein [Halomontanus rarus]|uniref:DUF7857 domain-containing protein n=1 Tax=Halomontanus rarus TaxID=3034020 RepID=UPI0023E8A185|nr:hypothetical protein [Halovivax sp. TS33]